MPQIWMTYDEIAELIGSNADAARAQAMHRSLDRRKSRDGLTRVKLDLEWTTRFIAAIREADPALDQAIRQLQGMRDAMYRGDHAAGANLATESGRSSQSQQLSIRPEKRVWPVKSPDQDLVRHDIAEPLARKPDVEVEGRRFDLKRWLAQFAQVEDNCMVRRRADRRRDTGEQCQCCAVDVTGGDEAHARVALDDWRELAGIEQILAIHVQDSGPERRMMQEHQGWPLRVRSQRGVKPLQRRHIEQAVRLARYA